jgi:membrane-associated phospholipid phosphatase
MFQTEPILWLQSFASDWLTALMGAVSTAGNSSTYLTALIIVGFAGDLRLAAVLAQGVLWNLVLSGCLKDAFALPRPADTDSRVRVLGRPSAEPGPFVDAGGIGFLDLPSPEAISYARAGLGVGYGFPSGHAGNATVFWGGLALHSGSVAAWSMAVAFVVAISLSRVYLGVHFVADVLGGVVAGSLVLGLLGVVFVRRHAHARLKGWDGRGGGVLTPILAASAVLPVLVLAVDLGSHPTTLGRLTGFNGALLMLMRRGLPQEGGSAMQRMVRVLVAFILYGAVHALALRALRRTDMDGGWAEYGAAAAATLALVAGTVRLSERLRLYGVPGVRTR